MLEFIILGSALLLTAFLLILGRLIYEAIEFARDKKCPQCRAALAAREIDRKMLGIYKKYKPDLFGSSRYSWLSYRTLKTSSARFIKFRRLNQCRYCGFQWASTFSQRA